MRPTRDDILTDFRVYVGGGAEGAEFESNCNSDQLFSIHFTHKFSLYILSETFQPKVLAGFQTVNIDSFSVQPQTLS